MDKKTKDRLKNIALALVFVLGLGLAAYPMISNFYYRVEHDNQVANFIKERDKIDSEELSRRMDLARAYNETLDPSRLADPYTEREEEGRAEYAKMLELEEKLGFVDVPKIDQRLPVYAGTTDSILLKAAGHLEGTSLPIGGESTHAVVTAHRGLARAKLFRDLDRLKEGDVFYFTNIETTLAYQVDKVQVIEPWDFDPVLVKEGEDLMTLLTCTPYMINSHRLLVRGHRIDYDPYTIEKATESSIGPSYKDMALISLVFLALALVIYIRSRVDYDRLRKGNKLDD